MKPAAVSSCRAARPERPRQRQGHVAVLLIGHSAAPVRREPVLVRFPERHPGQRIPALADEVAGRVPVARAGVGAVQPPPQDQPDGCQGHSPEDDAGIGEQKGLDGVCGSGRAGCRRPEWAAAGTAGRVPPRGPAVRRRGPSRRRPATPRYRPRRAPATCRRPQGPGSAGPAELVSTRNCRRLSQSSTTSSSGTATSGRTWTNPEPITAVCGRLG